MIATVECGSISEASKRLFISQPSLSNAIRELERTLGKVLFFRTPRGMILTEDGAEFLGYARQVLQQMEMLEKKYDSSKVATQRFSVSTQHYTFAANAFVELVKSAESDFYEFTLFEGRTREIIDNVRNLKSELGILYLSDFNEAVINHLLRDANLSFCPLFTVKPHVFLSKTHPLAAQKSIDLSELASYPCVTYDQGINNSFYLSEEILSTRPMNKHIIVTDRAAVVNFLIGLDAYTISTGIFPTYLHGTDIISSALNVDERIEVGVIRNEDVIPSKYGILYQEALEKLAAEI